MIPILHYHVNVNVSGLNISPFFQLPLFAFVLRSPVFAHQLRCRRIPNHTSCHSGRCRLDCPFVRLSDRFHLSRVAWDSSHLYPSPRGLRSTTPPRLLPSLHLPVARHPPPPRSVRPPSPSSSPRGSIPDKLDRKRPERIGEFLLQRGRRRRTGEFLLEGEGRDGVVRETCHGTDGRTRALEKRRGRRRRDTRGWEEEGAIHVQRKTHLRDAVVPRTRLEGVRRTGTSAASSCTAGRASRVHLSVLVRLVPPHESCCHVRRLLRWQKSLLRRRTSRRALADDKRRVRTCPSTCIRELRRAPCDRSRCFVERPHPPSGSRRRRTCVLRSTAGTVRRKSGRNESGARPWSSHGRASASAQPRTRSCKCLPRQNRCKTWPCIECSRKGLPRARLVVLRPFLCRRSRESGSTAVGRERSKPTWKKRSFLWKSTAPCESSSHAGSSLDRAPSKTQVQVGSSRLWMEG